MSKLVYPANGLNNIIKDDLSTCLNMLNSASNNIDYTVPINFNYRTYMNDLKNNLKNYKKEMDDIIDAINKVNKTFNDVETDMEIDVKKIGEVKIEKRDRLIKV